MEEFNGTDFELSTLAIPVKEQSELLNNYYAKYSNSGSHGICSHITIVFPLFESLAHYEDNKEILEDYVKSINPFILKLTRMGKFPENGVLYLQPDHEVELLKITNDLLNLFPFVEPYQGLIRREEIHHHNTLAVIKDPEKFSEVESILTEELNPLLPISFTFDELCLMVRSDGKWFKLKEYKLSI